MPLWLGAGLADWYIHRRTRIQDTAGPRESDDPVVLGGGKRFLADDGMKRPMRLVDSTVTSTGAILATYEVTTT